MSYFNPPKLGAQLEGIDCASVRQVDEAGRSYIIGQRFRPSLNPETIIIEWGQ